MARKWEDSNDKERGAASVPDTGLLRLSLAVMKHHSQKQKGRKGFISPTVPYNRSSAKAMRAGTHTGQGPGARS